MLYPRHLKPLLIAAAQDTPVILVNGARQTGKSTLLTKLFPEEIALHSITFDDVATLAAAKASPQSFFNDLPRGTLIDEVQHAVDLFLSVKQAVDTNRVPGRFFLTGSANIMTLPKLSESLAGRIEIHTLWPFSQGELRFRQEGFIDTLFSDASLSPVPAISTPDLLKLLTAGGYPEAVAKEDYRRRSAWFTGYLTSILQRDVRDLSNIEGLTSLPNLLALLASRTGALLNASDLSRSLGLPATTLKRYLTLLEMVFITVPIAPWFKNIGKRLVKSPRIYMNDTGLLCHLLGVDEEGLAGNRNLLGPVLENFVVMELLKQSGWSKHRVKLFHYRTITGQEVDIVLALPNGRLIGIEVKSVSKLTSESFKGLQYLQAETGQDFHRGIILYTGTETLSFGERLTALPVSALWEMNATSVEPLQA